MRKQKRREVKFTCKLAQLVARELGVKLNHTDPRTTFFALNLTPSQGEKLKFKPESCDPETYVFLLYHTVT